MASGDDPQPSPGIACTITASCQGKVTSARVPQDVPLAARSESTPYNNDTSCTAVKSVTHLLAVLDRTCPTTWH